MLTFVTDQRPGEPCIIKGNALSPLQLKSLDDMVLAVLLPEEPWTHERLASLPMEIILGKEVLLGGVNAFLGDQWVGGTEV